MPPQTAILDARAGNAQPVVTQADAWIAAEHRPAAWAVH
jgi:hypothetical protein